MNVSPPIKTVMQTFRISPALKEALREEARQQHRPIGNLIEFVLLRWLEEQGIQVRQPGDPEAVRRSAGGGDSGNLSKRRLPGNAKHDPGRPGQKRVRPRQRKGH